MNGYFFYFSFLIFLFFYFLIFLIFLKNMNQLPLFNNTYRRTSVINLALFTIGIRGADNIISFGTFAVGFANHIPDVARIQAVRAFNKSSVFTAENPKNQPKYKNHKRSYTSQYDINLLFTNIALNPVTFARDVKSRVSLEVVHTSSVCATHRAKVIFNISAIIVFVSVISGLIHVTSPFDKTRVSIVRGLYGRSG
tara:strand:+ start:41 stop:628 length:588 start_codon:yes stop_codon:yes gene_type:complete